MSAINEQVRLARMEAACNQLRDEMDDVLDTAYAKAVEEQDETLAAALARQKRNKLLQKSDAEFAFDRFGLDLPETISATNMLNVFKSLILGFRTMLNGDWAGYRQSLRDLTTQAGFPFNIDWPVAPGTDENAQE